MFYFCGGGSAMLNVSANYQTLLVIALTGFASGILVVVFMGHRYQKILCAMRKTYHLMHGQERRNETIVEALPVGLEIYNTDGSLRRRNRRICEILGEPADCKGTLLTNPRFPKKFKDAFLCKESIREDFIYRPLHEPDDDAYDANSRYIECHGRPVLDDNGKVINYLFIIADTTQLHNQRKQTERHLRIAQEAIRTSNLRLWRFDTRSQMFASFNDPITDYNGSTMISADEYFSYMHPDDVALCREKQAQMIFGNPEPFEIEVREKTPADTQWQYCTVSGSPFSWDEAGIPLEYVGFRRNNTAILDLMRQNKLILDNINSGLVFLSPDYRVQWGNEAARMRFMTEGAYKDGCLCYETIGKQAPCAHCVMTRALQSGHTESKIFEHEGKTIEVFATPAYNSVNKLEGVVLRLDDVTLRHRLFKELYKAKKDAERSDKLKSAFLANMSHEIRTPLNAIVGFSELLTTVDNPEERAEFIRIIRDNNDQLLRLIGDILNLSKFEAGYLERIPEEFDLAIVFSELLTQARQQLNNSAVKLICDNPYPYCRVCMDRNRLMQVMHNYITNAIKYTPAGSIRMGYEYQNDGIRLYVSDTGIGIPREKQELVYHRFEKFNSFAQGTGLGLSIAKALTETAGGKVGFESQEGKGSTFWSWIPCKVSFDPSGTETSLPVTDRECDLVVKQSRPANKKKILVAEDVENNYKLLEAILGKQYMLTWVMNGIQAVEKVGTEEFDLILMDMKMPDMDGITATCRIRGFDTRIPIIALTAHAYDSDRAHALSAGCNDYCAKPVNKTELLPLIEKWLNNQD